MLVESANFECMRTIGDSRPMLTRWKVMVLSYGALAFLLYSLRAWTPPASNGPSTAVSGHPVGDWRQGSAGQNDTVRWDGGENGAVRIENGTAAKREAWKREAGWESVGDDDLEDWAPLGPDPPGCLPRAPPTAEPVILVGWGFGSTRLTLYTYRALESVLHVYPGARVKFITVGPPYAYYYKWSNIIALTQFQKYVKRGYDVKVEIYAGQNIATVEMQGGPIPGHRWWQRHQDTLLYGKGLSFETFQATQDALPDASTTLYLALIELYKFGGIYVDLTTFFVRPLPPGLDGFVAGGDGPETNGSPELAGGATRVGDCSARTASNRRQRPLVMQYSTPGHPVVVCALLAYDLEASPLNECIAGTKGRGYGGLDCVLETLEACTQNAGTTNHLREAGVVEWNGCSEAAVGEYSELSSSSSSSSSGASVADTLEALTAIPPARAPSTPSEQSNQSGRTSSRDRGGGAERRLTEDILAGNSSEAENNVEEQGAGREPSDGKWNGGRHSVGDYRVGYRSTEGGGIGVDRQVYAFTKSGDSLADGRKTQGPPRHDSNGGGRGVVVFMPGPGVDGESTGGYSDGDFSIDGSRDLISEEEGGEQSVPSLAAETVSLLWMGSAASDGMWKAPAEGSLWNEVFSRLRLRRWRPEQVSAACRIPCGHWATVSPSGTSAPPLAKAQAGFQCAPGVFVPGTQKGASTFLFHAISWHPQVVQPLRGAHGFKETGRYSPRTAVGLDKLRLRLAAFPFVEEHENIVSGDGSVVYMVQDLKTPEAILADNPHAKIVFALRDPVARAWSDFRFMWNFYSNQPGFPKIIKKSLAELRKCSTGQDGQDSLSTTLAGQGPGELIPSEKEEEEISRFYLHCSSTSDGGQLVRKGIYYYQVLHWIRVFGRDSVLVVDSADLKWRQKETLEEVYRFLGLCPVEVVNLDPENVTQKLDIPDDHKINAEAFKALQDFYAPFNKKLYKLLGRDFGWEKTSFEYRR